MFEGLGNIIYQCQDSNSGEIEVLLYEFRVRFLWFPVDSRNTGTEAQLVSRYFEISIICCLKPSLARLSVDLLFGTIALMISPFYYARKCGLRFTLRSHHLRSSTNCETGMVVLRYMSMPLYLLDSRYSWVGFGGCVEPFLGAPVVGMRQLCGRTQLKWE